MMGQPQDQAIQAINVIRTNVDRPVAGTPYYFAYGSNLHTGQMKERCPDSKQMGVCTLPEFRLVFRKYADVEPAEGCVVRGAVYRLSVADEENLDIYEGFPKGEQGYDKAYFSASFDGTPATVMFYWRRRYDRYEAPPKDYVRCIRDGYRHWGLPLDHPMLR
ncbi:MAG: gamma-glutamylcyclotransferase [Dehalococcoidia bacterium]|nr:gamma-glutamylcyclotransferase [Dehalococcoidia bacterium]MSQ35402.1 gamma-glutamylcyclotransferase [Dehalococcoidia bacterium]